MNRLEVGQSMDMDDTFIKGRYGWCFSCGFVDCFQMGIVLHMG